MQSLHGSLMSSLNISLASYILKRARCADAPIGRLQHGALPTYCPLGRTVTAGITSGTIA